MDRCSASSATEGTTRTRINVKGLEQRIKEVGKSFEVHWYSVGHAFANPEYNKAAADAAWASTVEFLHRNLR
jgi:dienelactone hydrolase